jgi:ABC-2 type transport system ATP-binding protein
MLKVENITKYYGDFLAVDDLSFEVKEGEIFGLLGVNGAGKTTTFRMIMGLLDPTEGSITLDGKKIDYSVTDKIGFLTEERSLLTKMTVLNQAYLYGNLKGMNNLQIENRLDELLERFNVVEYKNKEIKELSKGNQQKIQFILAILNKPKLLICDEPFSGLDPFNVEQFKTELTNLSKEGSVIIFSSHRMDHVELFCEKLIILLKGKTVIEGKLKKIKKDYQKKDIFIAGDITKKDLENIEGVVEVIKRSTDYLVRIQNKEVTRKVFDTIKNKNITKFVVEEPSLDEIFVEKVGEQFAK